MLARALLICVVVLIAPCNGVDGRTITPRAPAEIGVMSVAEDITVVDRPCDNESRSASRACQCGDLICGDWISQFSDAAGVTTEAGAKGDLAGWQFTGRREIYKSGIRQKWIACIYQDGALGLLVGWSLSDISHGVRPNRLASGNYVQHRWPVGHNLDVGSQLTTFGISRYHGLSNGKNHNNSGNDGVTDCCFGASFNPYMLYTFIFFLFGTIGSILIKEGSPKGGDVTDFLIFAGTVCWVIAIAVPTWWWVSHG